MKELLFATTNGSKMKRFYSKLQKRGIELKSLKDIDLDIDIDENGKTSVENAMIKAKAYYDATHMDVMAVDDALYIDAVPKDKQPGVYVRRINGKRLTDEEMIDYYTNLAKEYGTDGKLNIKWILGMALIKDGVIYTTEHINDGNYFSSIPAKDRKEGYPLSSVQVNAKLNKYSIYVTAEEKEFLNDNDEDLIDFIDNIINSNERKGR